MSYVYLATPYTDYPEGHEAAFRDAVAVSAALIDAGLHVFSPVVHFHPISKAMPPQSHKFWMRQCRPFMIAAGSIKVAQLPGWMESRGVFEEIEFFRRKRKPISYLGWPLPSNIQRDTRYIQWLVGESAY